MGALQRRPLSTILILINKNLFIKEGNLVLDSGDSLLLAIILFCIVMAAYFSATETAFSSLNRIRLKTIADKGNKRALKTLKLVDEYDKLLSTILIGNNVVNILSSSLVTILFVKWVGESSGPTVATVVMTIVMLLVCEITPKSIAKEMPEKFAIISTPFLSILMVIFTPLNWLFTQWKKLVERIIKPDKSKGMTEEELIAIVEEAEQDGGIDEQESEIIQNAMDFTEQEAGNILTPRMEITAISTEATKEEVAKIFTETAYSRLPVYQDTIDHIIGVVYHKDFYNHVYNNGKTTEQIMRPVVFVSKTKKIGKLLKELQAKKSHIAVVLDEYGGTLGIVTLEDILEELVGEIWDEHDEVSADIEIKSENECLVSGNALLDSVFEYLSIEDNDELENKTVSMWIMDILGRYPKVGDTLTYHHLKLEIVKVDDYRVEKVKITH